MEKIIYYKSEDGVYFASANFGYSGRSRLNTSRKYNGLEPQSTFDPAWYFILSESLDKVEELVKGKAINKRYVLKDPELQSDKIPLRLSLEEIEEYYDDEDYQYYWSNPVYSSLMGLYQAEYDHTKDEWKEVEVEIEKLGDIEKVGPISDLKVTIPIDSRWVNKGTKEVDLSSIVRWDELHAMLTPEFLRYTNPCSLTSIQTYEIVRQYVKENINPKYAVVTSDYDFCFTVKKKIAIKPFVRKWEEKKSNGKSYARPKIKSKTIKYKEEEIFEMTSKEKKYGGYTLIEGFKGESLEDLIENLKLYLEELMEYINAPLKECECCHGTGHTLEKK